MSKPQTAAYLDDQAGEWFFRARLSRNGGLAMAWCAKTSALGDSPFDIRPSSEVHFEFAGTPLEALRKLKAEVLQ